MLSVDEARSVILENAETLCAEMVSLDRLVGRVAAEDVIAQITQPPFSASAMDGYAVQYSDSKVGNSLTVIGEAPAGVPFSGQVKAGEAVRIFTGGVVPKGADHIVIQEDVTRTDDNITINIDQDKPRHIRPAGLDFKKGDRLINKGTIFHAHHGAVLAAANIARVGVVGQPKVAIFSNGDELKDPGSTLKDGEIVNSNHYAVRAMVEAWGGSVFYAGCLPDNQAAIQSCFNALEDADIIVPIGGASVGDYDVVKPAFMEAGGEIVFEKIAVRPGKPTWFGRMGHSSIIGLPGNPASAIVTAALFLQPLVRHLAGTTEDGTVMMTASLLKSLPQNGQRENYLRARVQPHGAGYQVMPVENQDSGVVSPFMEADALIRRKINASALEAGELVEIVPLR